MSQYMEKRSAARNAGSVVAVIKRHDIWQIVGTVSTIDGIPERWGFRKAKDQTDPNVNNISRQINSAASFD